MKVAITIDLERDSGTNTLYGMKYGLPKILSILEKTNIRATFFSTGEIIEKFPKLIKDLSIDHEIGLHGTYAHERLNNINFKLINDIKIIKNKLENLIQKPVYGFRAPFLDIDVRLLTKLKDLGFKYDSSLGLYRIKHFTLSKYIDKKFEFRVLFPNIFFRFPFGYKIFQILYQINRENIVIFYLHPWEAINMQVLLSSKKNQSLFEKYSRLDRWINTGTKFLTNLEIFIENLKKKGFKFGAIMDFLD
ncbi:MAG: polysaccharide deacetylase family protein [Candidatus Helarchaeota archaeon]